MGLSTIIEWFSPWKYWLVSYRYQQKSDPTISGHGYRLVQMTSPPTLDNLYNAVEDTEPVTLIILNYQRLTQAEYNALRTRTEKDIEI